MCSVMEADQSGIRKWTQAPEKKTKTGGELFSKP